SLGPQIVLAELTGTASVLVRAAPRVARYRFLQIRPIPVGRASRILLERVEALGAGRIGADVEPVLIEPGADQLDLRFRRRLLRLSDASPQTWPEEPDEQPEHDDDDEQFDEREPALVEPSRTPRGRKRAVAGLVGVAVGALRRS